MTDEQCLALKAGSRIRIKGPCNSGWEGRVIVIAYVERSVLWGVGVSSTNFDVHKIDKTVSENFKSVFVPAANCELVEENR